MPMAETTLTRGTGYYIQGDTFSNNATNGDWSWYIGQWRQDYWNETEYGAGCVAYSVPAIKDRKTGRAITIPCAFSANSGVKKLKAVLSTTAPSGTEWRFGPVSGVVSDEISFGSGATSLTFAVTDGVDLSGQTVYLYLYSPDEGYGTNGSGSSVVTSKFSDAALTYTERKGGARISSGGTMKLYAAVIFTGGVPKRYIPMVYKSGVWKVQS